MVTPPRIRYMNHPFASNLSLYLQTDVQEAHPSCAQPGEFSGFMKLRSVFR